MTEPITILVSVPAIDVKLDLAAVRRFGDSPDGQLVAISYTHEQYLPGLSGPVLHFQLPDGRVVLTLPDPDGYQLVWEATDTLAEIDDAAHDALHQMWDAVNASFQCTLVEAFGDAAVTAIAAAALPPQDGTNAGAGGGTERER